ncbi:unnamed protein product [Musa acuminata subsp. malaccensis]|uniref:NADH dehydrogenase [ubiquinone] 1 alpha subcomplex subunit 13 n=1 Tax=Musa acuminata subsp. malaccensis TaxID=214687 RepID=A0A804KU79_MUSAM|nr:unnamed protein product [Musa acuminata subsp. malaccensis]
MTSVREMPLLQDGPPPGGFPPVRCARRIPIKGSNAAAIFLVAFSCGMYQVDQGNRIRRAFNAARRAILPMLQAEKMKGKLIHQVYKLDTTREGVEEEARIMKDVPGWKVGESVYNSGRWMTPATGELRPDVRRFQDSATMRSM